MWWWWLSESKKKKQMKATVSASQCTGRDGDRGRGRKREREVNEGGEGTRAYSQAMGMRRASTAQSALELICRYCSP